VKYVVLCIVILATSVNALSQEFPQKDRFQRRINDSIKASRDREHDRRLEESSTLPVPKPAVMNVDVQAVLSKGEYKTFNEAKVAEAKKIVDGDDLWLYVKFLKGKLGDYVLTTRDQDDREKLRYTLYAEIGPRGDITALNQYAMQFAKEDLTANELKINLAPGMFGRNKSIPVFLMTTGSAKPGVWNNEFRLTNSVTVPRAMTANLATTPMTLTLTGGAPKYKKMDADYLSIILRGSTDVARMPVAGMFFKEAVRAKVVETLATENIQPGKVYFSGDDWEEISSSGMFAAKYRRAFATFTYGKGEQCFYGIATVIEHFDFMQSKYGDPEISLQKDFPLPCTDVR
jgi:hypothetical protein